MRARCASGRRGPIGLEIDDGGLIGIGHVYEGSSAGFVEQEAFAMCRQVDVCDLVAQVLSNKP